jgi:hypothetical protein
MRPPQGQTEVIDEVWQPSLDDVLGDRGQSSKNGGDSYNAASGQSNTPTTSASASTQSSPRKWREWDAGKADEALREFQPLKNNSNANAKAKFPLLKETHRPVTIESGSRVKLVKVPTGHEHKSENSSAAKAPKSHQGNAINTPKISRKDKVSAIGKARQSGIDFRLLFSKVVNESENSNRPKNKSRPLDTALASLSTLDNPTCQQDQPTSLLPMTPLDINVGNSIGSFAKNDEEDLISFD